MVIPPNVSQVRVLFCLTLKDNGTILVELVTQGFGHDKAVTSLETVPMH